MKTSTHQEKRGIQLTRWMQLKYWDFPNDLAETSAAVGLKIHKEKHKVPKDNTVSISQITLDREALEEVETFMYLGSISDDEGGFDGDTKTQIDEVRATYLQLKNIQNSKQVSDGVKSEFSIQYYCTVLKREKLL